MKPARIELDFAPAAKKPGRVIAFVLLGLGLFFAAGTGEALWQRLGQLSAAESRLALANRPLRGRLRGDLPKQPDVDTLASLKRAAAVADQLGIPWADLFDALEAADAGALGLLSAVPNAREHSLRIAGEARTIGEVLAYVKRLAGQDAFEQVHLSGYTSALRDGVPVVAFNLEASWRANK